jgi:hypothetical protein
VPEILACKIDVVAAFCFQALSLKKSDVLTESMRFLSGIKNYCLSAIIGFQIRS